MAQNPEPLHALVIPYPTQGHMSPMMQLAKKLASKGLTVTFVTTHHRHHQIMKAHSVTDQVDPILQNARNLDLDIRSAQISDGLPLDFDQSARFSDFMCSVDNMGGELEQLIHNLNNKGPPISCVISHTALFWSLDVTKKFGIPWISFWTQPTTIYSIYYHAHLLEARRSQSFYKGSGDEGHILIDYIPGVPTLHPRDLPSFFNKPEADSQYLLDFVHKSLQCSRGAYWVLCNSFDDLESAAVNSSMNLQPPVVHVGPLLPSGYLNGENSEDVGIGTSIWTEYHSSQWLDKKSNGSVIYVSFGSMIHVSKAQLDEIAMGLKSSGQPFLWVLRPDSIGASTVSECLPDGFLDEMENQGLIVPWCNQLRVLSHPSIAGFITHCGWNSMLEGIVLGVPILNRGGHAGDNKLLVSEDISSAIRKLFTEESKEIKKNVKALKESATTAVRTGLGSSDKNIDNFVGALNTANAELKGKHDTKHDRQ